VLPAGSTGEASAKLTDGTATGPIVLDGRTTPLDFGIATQGPPVLHQRTFTLTNLGDATLTTNTFIPPPGFSLVTSFPSSLAPNASASFTLQLDTEVVGSKFGEVRFNTNDPQSDVFTFNVSGTVAGPIPPGSPTLTLPGPAVVYWAGAAPKVLDPTCDTSGASSYAGATLSVTLSGDGGLDDRLSVQPGNTPDGPVGVSGLTVSFNGSAVGTLTGGVGYGSALVVHFNATATQQAVRAVMRSIAYSDTSATPDTHRRYVSFDLTAGGLASNEAVKTVIFDTAPRPVLTSIVVGNTPAGTAQRSRVVAVTLTFDRPVSIAPGAATLVRLNTGGSGANDGSPPTDATAALAPNATTTDDGHTWVFSVAAGSAFVQNGSLADGIYTLTLDNADVSAFGVPLAGNPAPLVASSLTFHRLFGDVNGSKGVNAADFNLFRQAFGKGSSDPAYNAAFDFDNNGSINALDYNQFRSRFGKSLSY
jgi:hypothetical protein